MSTWKPNCGSSTPRSPRERPWDAAATPCTNPASFGSGIFFRAGVNGRAGELGIFEGFIGTVLEPDIVNHNRITGHDLAFVGRAIADHPVEPVSEARRSDHDRHRAGQYQSSHRFAPTARVKAGKCGLTKTVPAHSGLFAIMVNSRDRIDRSDGSDVAAFDLFA